MSMKKSIVLILCLLATVACEDPYKKSLLSEDTALLAVEGMLTSENTNHLVRLSRPYKTQNDVALPVSGAIVTITEGTTNYALTESPAGSGLYYTPIMRAVTGKVYSLQIIYNGKIYTAEDTPPPIEPVPQISYYKAGNDYSLNLTPSGTEANYINHEISWRNTSSCTTETGCHAKIVFYDLKTIDVHEVYKPKKEDLHFPPNSTIVRTKYSLSAAHKNFLRSMLSETEWRGGVFDVQRANTTTNLSDGAIGFFATSTILSDTTIVN